MLPAPTVATPTDWGRAVAGAAGAGGLAAVAEQAPAGEPDEADDEERDDPRHPAAALADRGRAGFGPARDGGQFKLVGHSRSGR